MYAVAVSIITDIAVLVKDLIRVFRIIIMVINDVTEQVRKEGDFMTI